jgi:hypothetical protein
MMFTLIPADHLILVGRLLLASTMVFTYPMECYVARHIILSYLEFAKLNSSPTMLSHPLPPSPPAPLSQFYRSLPQVNPIHRHRAQYSPLHSSPNLESSDQNLSHTDRENRSSSPSSTSSLSVHIFLTLFLWGITVTIAIVFHELSIVLALTGSFHS